MAFGFALLFFVQPVIAGPYEDANAAIERDDYATALELLRPLAEQGEAKAQFKLGYMFKRGQGVPQDYGEAVKWFRMAAEQGDSKGQQALGYFYKTGLGVPRDYLQAHMWLNLSAAAGDENSAQEREIVSRSMTQEQIAEAQRMAQTMLGFIYGEGDGVRKSESEDLRELRNTAEQGDTESQRMLGILYRDGLSVPQDYVQAHMWSNLSAAAGNDQAAPQRENISQIMTPEQIAEAQRMARDWLAAQPPQ